jgi:hypothetical protein
VIEPGREAWKITDPVVVAVSERFDVELIKNRVLYHSGSADRSIGIEAARACRHAR